MPVVHSSSEEEKVRRAIKDKLALPLKQKLIIYIYIYIKDPNDKRDVVWVIWVIGY